MISPINAANIPVAQAVNSGSSEQCSCAIKKQVWKSINQDRAADTEMTVQDMLNIMFHESSRTSAIIKSTIAQNQEAKLSEDAFTIHDPRLDQVYDLSNVDLEDTSDVKVSSTVEKILSTARGIAHKLHPGDTAVKDAELLYACVEVLTGQATISSEQVTVTDLQHCIEILENLFSSGDYSFQMNTKIQSLLKSLINGVTELATERNNIKEPSEENETVKLKPPTPSVNTTTNINTPNTSA